MSKGWWGRAPLAQKLAQIEGGIECGMTAAEIALVLDAPSANAVAVEASRKGLKFPFKNKGNGFAHRRQMLALRKGYFTGARDFSGVPEGRDDAAEIRFDA